MFTMSLEIFKGSNAYKVFDYLVDQEIDVSVQDICDGTGLSRTTVDKILFDMHDFGWVTKTRKIGRAQMYELNLFNDLMVKLKEAEDISRQQKEQKLMHEGQ